MSVSIVVECNGCGQTKNLRVSETGRSRDIQEAVQSNGWLAAHNAQHLCPGCIREALEKPRKKNTA